MTKNKTTKAKKIVIKKKTMKKASKQKTAKRSPQPFGPITTITTAPVAIGNSVRGSASRVVNTGNGVIVSGRDFMFSAVATASAVNNWCCVGGTPLAPAAFSDSVIRNYLLMYQKYRWRVCNVHYITSSPTSSNGDILFYFGKNRNSVYLNQTSTQFLPFVMSDENTVLGPQWSNHSAALKIQGSWKSTDYGMGDEVNDYADGEVFLLSKTTTTDSPGYVIFDYVVEFAELQISPRLLSLPLPRAQYYNVNLGQSGANPLAGGVMTLGLFGNNLGGVTATLPPNCTKGDVYKAIVDYTNSTTVNGAWTNGTPVSGGLRLPLGPSTDFSSLSLQDGSTIFLVYVDTGDFLAYANIQEALTSERPIQYGADGTGTTFGIQFWLSLVSTISTTNINPNF